MAITSAISTSFKVEILKAVHNFTNGGNVFNCALFKALASQTGTYGAATTSYTEMTGDSDELAATGGYTTKGFVLTNSLISKLVMSKFSNKLSPSKSIKF